VNTAMKPSLGKSPVPRPPGMSNQSRTTMHSGARSMSGTIAEVPLPDLIQLFSTSKKTGTLVLNHNFTIAKIHLDAGRIIYASISDMPDLDPLKAMFRILSWEDGDFDLVGPEPYNFPTQIEMPTEHILMEGLRQLDELRRNTENMPPFDADLAVPRPLEARLSALSAVELDVLQLVLNKQDMKLQQIIDASRLSDKEVVDIVKKLLDGHYLVIDDLI